MGAEVTLFEEELLLRMPELDLDATHLVLSARERTGPGCGRKVLGSCVVGRGSCVGEEGRHHWLDMLRAAPDIVVRTHSLAALAAFPSHCLQQSPPPYQNVFPCSTHDPDLPVYHRYQNIGLISSQSFPVVEIPGPQKSQIQKETLQTENQEHEGPSSSDECQSSELLTPEQSQSPEPAAKEGQDTENSSMNESNHSEMISSDQSHYSEISSPDQFPHERSSGSQSSEPFLSPRGNLAIFGTSNVTGADCNKEDIKDQQDENIYYNLPLSQKIVYDVSKVLNEPIYAKPDLTLKRNYKKLPSDTSDSAEVAQSSFDGSYDTSEPIYDSPDLAAQRIYDKVELQERHIYDKPGAPLQPQYENSAVQSENIYQIPDLTLSHVYQAPHIFKPHIYESPVSTPEHIYQMPYDSSLRRYQNINVFTHCDQRNYENVAMLDGRANSKRRYENLPCDHEISTTHSTPAAQHGVVQENIQSATKHYQDLIEEEQGEYFSLQYEESSFLQQHGNNVGDNCSDTSEIYHDARSSTKSTSE